MSRWGPNDFLFCPLGGTNEIGMNVNLYHYQNKWIMMDLGAGFADVSYPGISMLAPDLTFIQQYSDDFLGIVLTHAHEDHLGSVGFLWDQLRCPIYATPFTAGVVEHKLAQAGLKEAKITIIDPNKPFDLGPFTLEAVHITHSIPEMNAFVIKTDAGDVVHTGDWKFDPNPVAGDATDYSRLKRIGKEKPLALVCDSTNVFNPNHSGSEGDLLESITNIMGEQPEGLIVVSMFASNVARIKTIGQAARANGRKVALAGWSLKRIEGIARATGYMDGSDVFLSEEEYKHYPRDELVLIATGCQGEPNAQMNKIANNAHPFIKLRPDDTVIFSSKIIPGNEKRIFKLFNNLVRMKVNMYTEKDHFVHVSGHPSRPELAEMYDYIKPQIAIPVHGEPAHIIEHGKLAKECGVKQVLEMQNGALVKLAPGKPETISHVQTGYFAVDGSLLQPEEGQVMRNRRKMQGEGAVFVSVAISSHGELLSEPQVSAPGVLDNDLQHEFLEILQTEITNVLDDQRSKDPAKIRTLVKRTVKRIIKQLANKFPLIIVHVDAE